MTNNNNNNNNEAKAIWATLAEIKQEVLRDISTIYGRTVSRVNLNTYKYREILPLGYVVVGKQEGKIPSIYLADSIGKRILRSNDRQEEEKLRDVAAFIMIHELLHLILQHTKMEDLLFLMGGLKKKAVEIAKEEGNDFKNFIRAITKDMFSFSKFANIVDDIYINHSYIASRMKGRNTAILLGEEFTGKESEDKINYFNKRHKEINEYIEWGLKEFSGKEYSIITTLGRGLAYFFSDDREELINNPRYSAYKTEFFAKKSRLEQFIEFAILLYREAKQRGVNFEDIESSARDYDPGFYQPRDQEDQEQGGPSDQSFGQQEGEAQGQTGQRGEFGQRGQGRQASEEGGETAEGDRETEEGREQAGQGETQGDREGRGEQAEGETQGSGEGQGEQAAGEGGEQEGGEGEAREGRERQGRGQEGEGELPQEGQPFQGSQTRRRRSSLPEPTYSGNVYYQPSRPGFASQSGRKREIRPKDYKIGEDFKKLIRKFAQRIYTHKKKFSGKADVDIHDTILSNANIYQQEKKKKGGK